MTFASLPPPADACGSQNNSPLPFDGVCLDGAIGPKGLIELYTTEQIQTTTQNQPSRLQREAIFRTFTATDLLAMDFPEVPYVIPGILPEGMTHLVGKPKVGKSFMALGFCVAVATGGVALGTNRVQRGEALYLPLEDHPQRLASRLRKVRAGASNLDGLRLRTDWPRFDEGGADLLDDFLSTHPNTRLVVIDTLARVRPRTSGQNVYAEDYAALEDLVRIAGEQGVAIVVVHHLRKMAAADPLDEINASTGLTAAAG
jgi:RecA-family ATPase